MADLSSAADLFRLDGRVALVTGGAGLLGRRYCEALLEQGARVVIGDLDGARAAALADELSRPDVLGTRLDVADEASVQATVDAATGRFGRLDILVNNAALTVRGGSETLDPKDYFAPFEHYRRDVWDQAVAVNLTGMILCAQAAGRQMLSQGGGVIVNISSTYGVVAPDQRLYEGVSSPYADTGFNTPVSYAVTKTAVLGLTRYLAAYWGRQNIRVNALTPHGVYDNHDATFVHNFVARSPMGRMARNDEYRGALLFLVSDASSYMTGELDRRWRLDGVVSARTVRIGTREVGDGRPCFVLAEGGVNHNGDPKLAEDLVRIAADCQADAVKFQKRTLHELLTRAAIEKPYVNPNSLGATYGEHRLKLELSEEVWLRLRDLATGLGLEFLGSAWDRGSADVLEALDAPAFKTASAVLTDLDLLDYIARKRRPMIVSTGMSSLEEVDQAVERILRHTDQLILLQCTSSYPSEFADVNLRVMDTYRQRYGVLVGYSGHERGISVTEAAATLGACLVERHFTRDRTLPGPDHAASLEPIGLAKLVRDIRQIEVAMGSGEKRIAAAEIPVRMRLAKSVVAARDIPAGAVVSAEMLTAKGPGDGIPANHLARLVGRVAAVAVAADTLLPTSALDWAPAASYEANGSRP